MSYGQGTDEFRMGEQGIYPGPDIPPGFNWAAHAEGLAAAQNARARGKGKPARSGADIPFAFGLPDMDGGDDGGGIGVLLLLLLVAFVVVEFLAVILLCAVTAGIIYLLWQVPDERYEAAWRWLVARARKFASWSERKAQGLQVKTSAAHRRFAKWRRRFTAQRRGRPLPAVERIRRR